MATQRIRISPRYLSDIAWDQWIEAVEEELAVARPQLEAMTEACEKTRPLMDYNTGSMNFSTVLLLYVMIRNLRPQRIVEVGTFIGKSTLAMAMACDRNNQPAEIITCDGSNDFHLPKLTKTPVQGFSKTISTALFGALVEKNMPADLVHIDGRLSPQDLDLLEKMSNENLVVVLDDFEGIEKGVANLNLMRQRPRFQRHALLYPPSERILKKIGTISGSTTAILVPMSSVGFTNQ